MEDKEQSRFPKGETCQQNDDCYRQSRRSSPNLHLDLNRLPYPVTELESSEDQEKEHCSPGSMLMFCSPCSSVFFFFIFYKFIILSLS